MATSGNLGNLSTAQRRAIAALLLQRDARAAAAAAKVGYRTLCRWLTQDSFRAALTQAETETIDAATRRLLTGQDKALSILSEIMDNRGAKDSDRRQAAGAWLDFAYKWRELKNIEQRLADLEAAVYDRHNNQQTT